MTFNDVHWMQYALDLAKTALNQGEVPVGAVLIDANQRILGSGWNHVRQWRDPTAHAEILAVRQAAKMQKNERLNNTTLYVTLEPCCMCAGALIHARVKRVVFATRDLKAGAAGSVYNLLAGAALNHKVQIDDGPLQIECAALLSDFFNQLREN